MARKPTKAEPWHPVEYEIADIGALQALETGTANEGQQKRALRWIVQEACRTYDLSFRADSERETCFAEGKRFVGLQIVKLLKINPSQLRKPDDRTGHPGGSAGP